MSLQVPTIIAAEFRHAKLLGEILGDAFHDDPCFNWVIPHRGLHPRFFQLIAEQLYLHHGEVYLEQEGRGAALWLPPGVSADTPVTLTQLWLILRLLAHSGPGIVKRLLQARDTMADHHPQEPHYYLHAIGARRQNQGQGVGSTLLKSVTRKCDEAQLPAYLESSSPRNSALYRCHGFVSIDIKPIGRGGPPVEFMWRSPEKR